MPAHSTAHRRRPGRPVPIGPVMICALIACVLTGLSAAPASASSGAGSHARTPAPRTAAITSSAFAVLKEIGVGSNPWAVAVSDAGDRVYVANAGSDSVSVIDGRTGTVTTTIGVGLAPWGVAVNQRTGTVYVTNANAGSVSVIDGGTLSVTSTIGVGVSPQGVAVNNATGTVYVVNAGSSSVSVIDGRTATVTGTIAVPGTPFAVAVSQHTGTVFVVGQAATDSDSPGSGVSSPGFISVINGRTQAVEKQLLFGVSNWSVAVHDSDDRAYVTDTFLQTVSAFNGGNINAWSSVNDGEYTPWAVAVDQASGGAYVTKVGMWAGAPGVVSIIDPRDLAASITLRSTGNPDLTPRGVAVDQSGTNAGIAYIAALAPANAVFAVGRTTAASSPGSGAVGTAVRISLSAPSLSARMTMDDDTVTSVTFGGVAGTSLAPGPGNTWTVTAPPGRGSVPVVVWLNGGQRAKAGAFAYRASTKP